MSPRFLEALRGPDYVRKVLYRVYSWADIEPIYGQPWADSIQKAHKAAQETYRRRRENRRK